MDEDVIHDGILVECGLNVELSFSQYAEELHDETDGLHVVEDSGIVVGVEDEVEVGVDDFFEFVDVVIVVDVFEFEAEFEVLVVEDADVALGIVDEGLDHASRAEEVGVEEFGEGGGFVEDGGVALELT